MPNWASVAICELAESPGVNAENEPSWTASQIGARVKPPFVWSFVTVTRISPARAGPAVNVEAARSATIAVKRGVR